MSLRPQHATLPSATIAHVSSPPVASAFAPRIFATFTGFFELSVVPSPSAASAPCSAVARTANGHGVAAIVVPDGVKSTAALERELEELKPAFGVEIEKLVYGMTDKPDRPLEVELVPVGELL